MARAIALIIRSEAGQIVFMLVGGTKRTQDKDIARAKSMAQEI